MEGDACGTDRTVERNTGNCQRSRSTDHRSDVRIGFLAGRHDSTDDLYFVLKAFWEQRTDRTIDQARGQRFLFGRTCFTFEEATRDLAGCVGLFLVVDRKREKAFAWVGGLGTGDGDQHGHIVINGDQYGTSGLTGNSASLEGNGRLTELEFLDYRVHGGSFSLLPWGNRSHILRAQPRAGHVTQNLWAGVGVVPTAVRNVRF